MHPVSSHRVRPGALVPFQHTQLGHRLVESPSEMVGAAYGAARETCGLDILQCHGAVVGDDDRVVNRLARIWPPVGTRVRVNPPPVVLCGRQRGGRRRRDRETTQARDYAMPALDTENDACQEVTTAVMVSTSSIGIIDDLATYRCQSKSES